MNKFIQVTAGRPFKIDPTTDGETYITGVTGEILIKPNDIIVIIDDLGKVSEGEFNYVEDHYIVINNGSYISYTTAVFVGKVA